MADLPTKGSKVVNRLNNSHHWACNTEEGRQVDPSLTNVVADERINLSDQRPLVSMGVLGPKLSQEPGCSLLLGIREKLQIIGLYWSAFLLAWDVLWTYFERP